MEMEEKYTTIRIPLSVAERLKQFYRERRIGERVRIALEDYLALLEGKAKEIRVISLSEIKEKKRSQSLK